MSSRRSRKSGTRIGNDVETIIKIFAEQIFGDGLVEIAIGGCDNPHIDGNLTGAADRAHGTLLQHTQQLSPAWPESFR